MYFVTSFAQMLISNRNYSVFFMFLDRFFMFFYVFLCFFYVFFYVFGYIFGYVFGRIVYCCCKELQRVYKELHR